MTESVEWGSLYAEWQSAGLSAHKLLGLPDLAVRRITSPEEEDVRWLVEALGDEKRKLFVAKLVRRAESLSDVFFGPLLDAGIDEINPSLNRIFIEPCVTTFGHRRVNEYLLDVVELGTDFRRAGAVNALYWAQVPLVYTGKPPSYSAEYATPESRAAYETLADLRKRKMQLLLKTFVSSPCVEVRRSIIPRLNLDPTNYPEGDWSLVARAIEIARSSEDKYIRHRVEVQLGNVKVFAPLPHREKEEDSE